jgi:hypothetical protein
LIGAIMVPLVPNYSILGGLSAAFLFLLIPTAQGAVDLVNNTVAALLKATGLAKLDFPKGLPREFATLVAIPTLLLNEKQVRELIEDLEVRYLANQDPNIHFALLSDLPDSVSRPRPNDTDPLVELAVGLINNLNTRYGKQNGKGKNGGGFYLLHRHRIFNARQGVWMGWERKRGKLLDLNKFILGEFDSFPVKIGNLDVLRTVRYVITLDSDTQLPRGTAHAMVGAMTHPLNRAVIDPHSRIVTEGYGILQPRVGVSVHSASRSRLAAIYSGQTGFDIYTRAVSDAYQDLYGEGIFTGKGIYEVQTLHAVLDRRFPRNSLLSHDLIEGAYARARLADCAVALRQGAGRERPHGEEPDLEHLALEDLRQPAAIAGGDADVDPAGGGMAGAAGGTAVLDAGDAVPAVRAEPGLAGVQRGTRVGQPTEGRGAGSLRRLRSEPDHHADQPGVSAAPDADGAGRDHPLAGAPVHHRAAAAGVGDGGAGRVHRRQDDAGRSLPAGDADRDHRYRPGGCDRASAIPDSRGAAAGAVVVRERHHCVAESSTAR